MKWFFTRVLALLVLGRISNLPTIWGNVITGCFLATGTVQPRALIPLLTATTFLYIGGMYLNDFCDASFDARHCPQRPIPAGKIKRRTVGVLSVVWLGLGLAGLSRFHALTFGIGVILAGAIVLYDFAHKNISWAPLVMGLCRFLLYPLAGSISDEEMSWHVFLWGATIGLFVMGITYLARGESKPGKPARWSYLLLSAPFIVAGCFAVTYSLGVILAACLVLAGWMAWVLVPLSSGKNRSIGRVISGLLAGIIIADATIIAPVLVEAPGWAINYLALFLTALLLQRIIPAT